MSEDKGKCLKVIADHSTIHGIKETYEAPIWQLKGFWVIVILTGVAIMAMQLYGLSTTYWLVETGTKVTINELEYMPTITVFPGRWAKLDTYRLLDPEIVSGYSDEEVSELSNYMEGYFYYGPMFSDYTSSGDLSAIKSLAKYVEAGDKMMKKYNNSLELFTKAHAPKAEDIFTNYSFPPLSPNFELGAFTSHGGVYYTLKLITKLQTFFADMSMLVVELDYSKLDAFGSMFMLTGGFDMQSTSGRADLMLIRGIDYTMVLKAHKSVQISRYGHRCNDWYTRSDYQYCQMADINTDCETCKWYLPRSTHFPENTDNGNLCHMVKNGFECQNYVQERAHGTSCDPPCTQDIYEVFISGTGESVNPNKMKLYIRMASAHLNNGFIEYPLLSLSNYLSGLGGTVSLWFGASILSLVQVGYLFWYITYSGIAHRKRNPNEPSKPHATVIAYD